MPLLRVGGVRGTVAAPPSQGQQTALLGAISNGAVAHAPSLLPVFRNIVVTPTSTGAVITASVSPSAQALVEYDADAGAPYASATALASTATSHSRTISGLSSGTLYHFRWKGINAAGEIGYSPNASFQTLGVSTIQGYGAETVGGNAFIGSPRVVTNLNNSGSGSYREAVAFPNGYVTFGPGVNGVINLTSKIFLPSGLTIDGTSCNGSGITFTGFSQWFALANSAGQGSSQIIMKGLRFHDNTDNSTAPTAYVEDALTGKYGSHHIVVDHCSFHGQQDGAVDFSFDCHDVSMQWNIFGPPYNNPGGMLVNDNFHDCYNMTWHHNMWSDIGTSVNANFLSRTPCFGDDSYTETVVSGRLHGDVRCNLVWAPTNGYVGMTAQRGCRINAVKCYNFLRTGHTGVNYTVQTQTGGTAYASGNVNRRGGAVTTSAPTTEVVPGAAFRVTEDADARSAAAAVLAGAGCRVGGLDAYDANLIGTISDFVAANGGW